MNDLYPTPTRLRLLAEVAANEVYRLQGNDYDWAGRFVNMKMGQIERAGWARLDGVETTDGRRFWLLTDEGRAVLKAGAR